jgi:hypothetical protein
MSDIERTTEEDGRRNTRIDYLTRLFSVAELAANEDIRAGTEGEEEVHYCYEYC